MRNFDCGRAEEIIERSARAANLLFEPGLSARIARDLAVHNTVLPSELQIVGTQLQNRRIFNTRDYQRAGGKEHLVYGYVEDVIESSGHPETARLLLRSLVSEENTRVTLSLQEIARRTETGRDVVLQTLNHLAQSRLVREIQDEEPWRYELMHEYLIEKIHQITGKLMDATQRANRLFRQYLTNYSVDKGARIPLAKLRFIRRYSDLERGERERELLARSLRSGLVRLSLFGLVLSLAALLAAAALSERNEWEVGWPPSPFRPMGIASLPASGINRCAFTRATARCGAAIWINFRQMTNDK